jgi:hypothetical protein
VATYAVLPDTLDLLFVAGDEVSVLLDFDQNLTGYTFETGIYEVTEVTNGAVTATQAFSQNFTIMTILPSEGRINLSLTETNTLAFSPAVTYRWYMRWVAPGIVTRTVISGTINARLP